MANRAIFDSYSRALSTNEKQAAKALKETLGFLAPTNEQESRDLLQDLFPALVHQYGRQAATVVCEYYKSEREDAGISEPYEPILAGDVPYEDLKVMIESALNDAAANTLTSVTQNMLSQQVMNHADRTLIKNIACDPAHPKWALVPHMGACGWCVLLGSQGFVYNSEFTGNNARHDHCTCSICVDFSDAPELEGYDHKAMQKAYSQAYDAVIDDARAKWDDMSAEEKQKYIHKGKKKPSFDVYLRNRVVQEMNTRDRNWLQTGETPKVNYSDKARSTYGVLKSQSASFNPADYIKENFVHTKDNEWRDLFAHDALSNAGFAISTFNNKCIDIKISSKWWEIKSPQEPKGGSIKNDDLRFVESNMRRAVAQFEKRNIAGGARIVLNTFYRAADDAAIEKRAVFEMKRHNVSELLVVRKDGSISHYSK